LLRRFTEPAHLQQRCNSAPYAQERQTYLLHLQQRGHSSRRLAEFNKILLAAAERIDIEGHNLDLSKVTVAADAWIKGRTRQGTQARTIRTAKTDFVSITSNWLRFLGRWNEPRRPIPFAEQLEDFLRHLARERGLSGQTVLFRKRSLVQFLDWLYADGGSIAAATPKMIADYFAVHGERCWMRRTVVAYVQSLRSFFTYAASHAWCAPGIAETIDRPSIYTHELLPQGPPWKEVQRLIAGTRGDQASVVRDHAVILLLSLYGFRIGEVSSLTLEDIDWTAERIHVRRSKQRKIQDYPLTAEVGEAILRYLRQVRPRSPYRELFLRLKTPFRPITPAGLGCVIAARIRQLGIQLPHYGPHVLRHSCATHLLSEGFSLKEIGDHLGHRSNEATQIYAKVDDRSLRQVAQQDLTALIGYAIHRQVETCRADSQIEGLREVASLRIGGLL